MSTDDRSQGQSDPAIGLVAGVIRLAIGWVFLWAFLDKTFGLGHATASKDAWLDGGSPTNGFLSFATDGPFKGIYRDIAGQGWADWLFMLGLLGIGVALMLGIAMRLATVAGALLLVLMWSAVLPPASNPFMDDHLIYAATLVLLTLLNAGRYLGIGRMWEGLPLVQRTPWLR
ncbi:hypothetical protein [Nocardioides marmoriginsengisoli]|uniref:hypothetical protein n=1 Tax=Nocardioides marmoriginsengisoli TaxID=661483 RepID=UPI001619CF98|nr:hypothetical protein [Nocardioides marmoriginsengisoli]